MAPWKRTYWAVWSANVVTAVGMMSFLPFFPSHLARLGLTDEHEIATWTGLIFGAAPFAAAFMTPIWGALGDRFGRRLMTMRAMLAITLFVGAMALATAPWQLFVLRLCQGVFSGFVAPSVTLVSVVAPVHRQGQVAGSLQTSLAIGAIVGPLLGGVVGASLGLDTLFLGVAGASLVGAAIVFLFAREGDAVRRREEDERGVGAVLRGTLRDLRGVWANDEVRGAVVLLFVLHFGLGASNPLLELFVADLRGVHDAETQRLTGYLFTTMALVNFFALTAWGKHGDRRGHRGALVLCAAITAVALGLHAAVTGLALLFVARVVLGLGMAGSSPLAFGLAAREVPIERRGGAIGVVFSARVLAVSTSSMIGGWVAGLVGLRGLFLLGGALIAVALVALRWRAGSGAAERVEPTGSGAR